ncbi:Protein of unknown function [Actinacidiphila glaucinigra]|uniref:Uncharacterized protein n=1 Tax=Actinacidiphila glaucinigra TaxID=235986 RepID=A0A239AW86_9ACTN|nr:Protein of unknown function [Actinacidiphila glaucinigra]
MRHETVSYGSTLEAALSKRKCFDRLGAVGCLEWVPTTEEVRAVTEQQSGDRPEKAILERISAMVSDERTLRELLSEGRMDGETERARLDALERELDQCWDLLRQRRAKTEAGGDPGEARVRSTGTVEGYQS